MRAHRIEPSYRFRQNRRIEILERRLPLTVSAVHLEIDSGYSASDKITNAPAIVGAAIGMTSIELDHNADGISEQRLDLMGSSFRYDPLSVDSSLAHTERNLPMRYRTIEVDELGNPGAATSWTDIGYQLDNIAPRWANIPAITKQPTSDPEIRLNLNNYVQDWTTDSQLQISFLSNSNPGLFDEALVTATHMLMLTIAPGQSGSAVITVRSTDRAGNASMTNVTIHVGNSPPVITSFGYQEAQGRMYTFFGTVSDNTNVAGLTVTFDGVLHPFNLTAVVQANGTFSVTAELVGLSVGTATAVTHDQSGLTSNIAMQYVTPMFVLGDMNGDGYVDAFDQDPFYLALSNSSAYLAQYPYMSNYADVGDINRDGALNELDVDLFEAMLIT